MPKIAKLTWDDICENPVYRALDPREKPFMAVRYLPHDLNPFAKRGIRVAALIPFAMFPHIKTVATIGMLEWDFGRGDQPGYSPDNHTIVVDSSGNTAHAVARLAPAFGYREVKVVIASDVPDSKRGILDALSTVDVIVVSRGKSVAAEAKEQATKPGHYHLNQYAHPGNPWAHEEYTGPEIVRALGGKPPAVLAAAMGSGGTVMGLGKYFKGNHPDTTVVGVRPKLGEQVPGARDENRMKEVVELPWSLHVHRTVEISRKESFERARRLWSAVEPMPGPTSGLAWGGLELYLHELVASMEQEIRTSMRKTSHDGGFTAAFVCPDASTLYSDLFRAELDTGQGVA